MKGQAFTAMKMLLGAVFAMGMLYIVYSFSQTQPPAEPSVQVLMKLAMSASSAPWQCFERGEVHFTAGELISASTFPTGVKLTSAYISESLVYCDMGKTYCSVLEQFSAPVKAESQGSGVTITIGEGC